FPVISPGDIPRDNIRTKGLKLWTPTPALTSSRKEFSTTRSRVSSELRLQRAVRFTPWNSIKNFGNKNPPLKPSWNAQVYCKQAATGMTRFFQKMAGSQELAFF